MRKSVLFPIRVSLALLATLSLVPVFGAETTNRYDSPRFAFLETRKVLATAAGISLTNYPDCDDATVERRVVQVYRADGTGENQDESFTKVLTEKGKRGNRTMSEYFQLPYSTVEVVKIEVLKPDGSVVAVNVAANSKEMIDDSQMAMNIYDPNSKILKVNIPQVEIGDVVHSIVRTTITRSIIPGEFADNNVFEGTGFIRHTTYEVYAPSDKPLRRMVLRDEVPGTIHYSTNAIEGGVLHHWEVTNVPRMFDEPDMPPYDMVLQRLFVSTTPTWQDVSKWYWELSLPHLQCTPDMKKTVAKLTAGATSDLQKVQALFYYVSKEIRYMGLVPEKDRPGFEPHDVRLTFENKYGVCRDKAALLVAMLREGGLKAYPVLISVGTKRDADLPEPFFNHAIVGVELKPGEYELMDPTAENTRDLLPSYDCDQSYLVARPEGETLRVSAVPPVEENLMRVRTTATLTPAGHLEAQSELIFAGINDTAYREAFSKMKADDQRRFFERNLKRTLPGARLKSVKLSPENMLDVSSNISARLDYTVDGMTASGEGKTVVSLPWIGERIGIVNFILDGAGLERRKYPMRTEYACGVQEEVSVKLSDGFAGAVSMPSYLPASDDHLSYARGVTFKDGTLQGSRELKLTAVEFNPSQYLKLKQVLKDMDYDGRKTPLLTLKADAVTEAAAKTDLSAIPPVESNARILESRKKLTVQDAHNALLSVHYVKRVLNYSGKKNEAEIKIGYNPSCEEARLLHAVVTSKDGHRQEISTNEINVMDAGWNASAKRYTGGKVLVANLPGVEIGSTLEVDYQVASKGKQSLAGFEPFQLYDALENKEFELSAPCDLPVRTLLTGPAGAVAQETNTTGGTQSFLWRAQNSQALPAEILTPPGWTYLAGAAYTLGDVKAYWKELSQTLADRSRKSSHAAEQARRLASQCKSPREMVVAIRDFVAKSIRLAGPSFTDLPLSELSAADTTLSEGYGHSADRAILLHAMLAAAGLKPEFVLASALPPVEGITNVTASFPLPHSFQYPLVRVMVDGTAYYLNDTDQYAQLGSTAHEDDMALVLSSQTIETIRAARDCDTRTEMDYAIALSDAGLARITITRRYFGTGFGQKKQFFSELPPEERRRYYQELVSDVAQGARPVGDLTTQFNACPGTEQFTVEVDNYAVVDGKNLYFDLPFTPSLYRVASDHRVLPLLLSEKNIVTAQVNIELPPGFRQVTIAPRSETFTAPGGQARITAAQTAGKYSLTYNLQSAPAIISSGDYLALLKVESSLGRKSSRVFLLQK
jgi:transglutaminase-like putative cysteine protease